MRHQGAKFFAICPQVFDRAGSYARLLRSLRHGRRNAQNQARIKRFGNDVFWPEAQILPAVGLRHLVADFHLGQCGNLAHTGQLHFFGDLGGATIKRPTEDIREAQHVIDLVRIVAAAGGDDAIRPRGLGFFGANFRLGVGQRQNHRFVGHGLDHFAREHAFGGAAEEHISPAHHIGQRAGIGFLCVARLGFVQRAGAAFVNHAFGVAHIDVLARHAQAHHHVQAGNGGCARATDGYFDAANGFAHQLQPVEQGRARDDGGAVLIVVEHRNLHALAQFFLDVETFRRLDVFEVDAAQRRLQRSDDVHQLVGIALVQFNIEHIDIGKFLEQAALAFHHRLARQRADIAQPQHRRAVGDHAHQIATRGVFGGFCRVLLNRQTGVGHAGRIGQAQIALVGQWFGRADGNFAGRAHAMIFKRRIAQGDITGRHLAVCRHVFFLGCSTPYPFRGHALQSGTIVAQDARGAACPRADSCGFLVHMPHAFCSVRFFLQAPWLAPGSRLHACSGNCITTACSRPPSGVG